MDPAFTTKAGVRRLIGSDDQRSTSGERLIHVGSPCHGRPWSQQGMVQPDRNKSGCEPAMYWKGAVLTVAGLTLPHMSQFDPPVAGEGSLDPMGLATTSERLANELVPGLRARMNRFRFLTAIAVASAVCEDFIEERGSDGRTTPQVAFEWLVLESFAHRSSTVPVGVPGMQKARAVRDRRDRLSANSYLKAPSIFGFHGVYKPLAIEFDIVTPTLGPGKRQHELVSAWERDNDLIGFLDRSQDSDGGWLRRDLEATLKRSLGKARSDLPLSGWSSEVLAVTLAPDSAEVEERALLRRTLGEKHPQRGELAQLLLPELGTDGELSERAVVSRIRKQASKGLGDLLDAIEHYEVFARILDVAFRTLRHAASSYGPAGITPETIAHHPNIAEGARLLPEAYGNALTGLQSINTEAPGFAKRFGAFSEPLSGAAFARAVHDHHVSIQSSKPPHGKRPWFETYKGGWLVRPGFEHPLLPEFDGPFVHPIRIHALRRFLKDTVT